MIRNAWRLSDMLRINLNLICHFRYRWYLIGNTCERPLKHPWIWYTRVISFLAGQNNKVAPKYPWNSLDFIHSILWHFRNWWLQKQICSEIPLKFTWFYTLFPDRDILEIDVCKNKFAQKKTFTRSPRAPMFTLWHFISFWRQYIMTLL